MFWRDREIEARALALLAFVSVGSAQCHSQTQRFLCSEGLGGFSSKFSTGVTVSVDAPKKGGFATHLCEATLQSGADAVVVARDVPEIDIDVMGADLGLHVPVVAFQIKDPGADRFTTYKVFSLTRSPRLLRTITGGDEYHAKDMDLRGRNEIWTGDAEAVDGFENFPLASWDFAPTVVLAFDHQRLVDVSSEFQPYFDQQITKVKSQIDPQALSEVRKSDGKLSSSSTPTSASMRTLVRTKIQVLEIVWSYLSSGREPEAWSELADMWPPADLDRIRGAIQDARARGILHQIDGVQGTGQGRRGKHQAKIFDCTKVSNHESYADTPTAHLPSLNGAAMPTVAEPDAAETSRSLVDSRPEPIDIGIPLSETQKQALPETNSQIMLNLVVDAAGKVQSAQLANASDHGPIGDTVLSASADWKFIPAFAGGHAVACHTQFGVSPRQ